MVDYGQKRQRMIQRIPTVVVYVGEQEKTLEFWRDGVGFEVKTQQSMGTAGRRQQAGPVPLVAYAQLGGAQAVHRLRVRERPGRKRFLRDRDVESEEGSTKMSSGTYAKFRDPDGTEFLLRGP